MGITTTELKNILVVEDEEEMRKMYELIFEDYEDKYSIDMTGEAEAGLAMAREKKYDLIILDMIMEPMPGDSFFVRLRMNWKTKHAPVLVVSVLAPHTLQSLKEINHVDFLQKPLKGNQLMEKIKQMIE